MTSDQEFWAGKRVCVTGGSGFLGWHLVRQLHTLGADVRVLCLQPDPAHPLLKLQGLQCHFGDVRDTELTRNALAGCQAIFHTAGTVAMWGPAVQVMHSVHVDGTKTILAAADPSARVVHTSSLVAVGAAHRSCPVTEDTPFTLDSLPVDYVHAKRAAELVALEAAATGQDVVVTNPGYLIGPEDHENSVMGRLCLRAWKGRVPVALPGGFNLVDVRDVARGHLLAAEFGRAGRRYLLGGEDHTFADLLRLLRRAAGSRARITPTLPGWVLMGLAAAAELRGALTGREPYPSFQHARLNRLCWFCRSERARQELGYHARPVLDSLTDAHAWFSAAGRLARRGSAGDTLHSFLALPATKEVRLAGEAEPVLDR